MCGFSCVYCVWNGEKLCCSASDMKEVGENVVIEYNSLGYKIPKRYSEKWYYGYEKPEWCPTKNNKAKEMNTLTKSFLEEALKKHREDDYEFKYKAYWGIEPTSLSSKNSQIKVTCKHHNLSFETYPKEFLNGSKLCPICRMEKYGFKIHDKELFVKSERNGTQDKDICVSKLCTDKELISKIIDFINNNIRPNIYYTYFINEDYTIDIEPGYEYAWEGLNNPNKGISVSVENKTIPNYINFGYAIVSQFILTSKKRDSSEEKYIQFEKVESFKGCPKRIFGDFICKDENISSFVDMPLFIGGLFDLSNNSFDDNSWDYAKENIEAEFGDYKITNNKFIKYRKELN